MKVLIISSTVEQHISVGKIATELDSFLNNNGIVTKVMYFMGEDRCERYKSLRPQKLSTAIYALAQISEYSIVRTPFVINKLHKVIKEYKPDVIQLIQPLIRFVDNNALFTMLGKSGVPVVYTMIDENPYLGDCDNAYDCVQFIDSCENCHAENLEHNLQDSNYLNWSKEGCRRAACNKRKGYEQIDNICFVAPQWVVERANASRMLRGRKFYAVDEYVNNKDIFYPRCKDDISLYDKYYIDRNKITITNVCRFSNPRKGGQYFLELARLMEDDDRFQFVHIGYDGSSDDLPSNFIPVDFVSNQNELAEFYSIADIAMITSLSDTMPNTSLEALSCGTPVCGFRITGIPYVADEPMGIYVKPKDVAELKNAIILMGKKTENLSKMCRDYALSRFSAEVSGNKMVTIYKEMISKDKR